MAEHVCGSVKNELIISLHSFGRMAISIIRVILSWMQIGRFGL